MNATSGPPHTNANFLVDLGSGDPNSSNSGFCEVIFPEFRIESAERAKPRHADQDSDPRDGGDRPRHLILRRGVTGALDLYSWWDKARGGKTPERRTVKVALLAEDHSTVICTWYFRRAQPVSLTYSPLNALQGTVLIETIELQFEKMEMR